MERDSKTGLREVLERLVPEDHPQVEKVSKTAWVRVTRCSGGMFTIALRSVKDGKVTTFPPTYFIVAKERVTKVKYPKEWLTQEVGWKRADAADLKTLLDFLDSLPTKVE